MKILILAQTPPPFHGQAIMQKYLVDAKWDWCVKKHIRLKYSSEINEVGKFKLSKIFELVKIVFKVWKERIKGEIDLISYPPSGPNRIPFYRDVATLLLIRWTTKKIIFHFHAGGINNLLEKLSPIENMLAKMSLQKPDASIVLLDSLKKEISWFKSKCVYVVPNGIPDIPKKFIVREDHSLINILTVGLISEEKGIFTILETAKELQEKYIKFRWKLIGEFVSNEIERQCMDLVYEFHIEEAVEFVGKMTGDEKWKYFINTDIFISLSQSTEAFPLVFLEAMMFTLPVVATNWRGIPEIIEEGKNGYLVPVKSPEITAEKLMLLIKNKNLRSTFGLTNRKKYLDSFTVNSHVKKIEKLFQQLIFNDDFLKINNV